jgi:transcriptional regulator with XRE-family HTH domain
MRDEHIGRALGWWRKRKNLAQDEVAGKLRLSPKSVSDIERGKKRLTDPELIDICRAMEVSVFDVLDYAYIDYRQEIAELVEETGGVLLEPAAEREASLSEMEEGFDLLQDHVNQYWRRLLRYLRTPTDVEILRSKLRERARQGEPEKARKRRTRAGSAKDRPRNR